MTLSYWIIGDHSDTERVSNQGELICLKEDIYRFKMSRWNPLGPSIHTLQNEGQEGKTGLL
jgi:hypothetical protein